ncbi:MAG: TetR/AcrR family transcriptional regulator [Sedimentisphaerales bacterium]|nr:TetR/AcrR family transcriptional regulator [Sedimentisphaerales bacterium]
MAHNNKQKQIMRVVEKLTTNRRFHEITLEEVAEAAGVGKGTIYRYFADKDDLFFQVATSGFEELCELLKRTVPRDSSFPEELLNACKQITKFFAARRQLLQMMQTEANLAYRRKGKIRRRWLDRRKMLVNVLADIFYEGIAEGVVRADISAEVMATYLLGLLRTRARELQDVPENMKNCKLLVDMFLNGVCMSFNKASIQKMAAAEMAFNL